MRDITYLLPIYIFYIISHDFYINPGAKSIPFARIELIKPLKIITKQNILLTPILLLLLTIIRKYSIFLLILLPMTLTVAFLMKIIFEIN